MPDTSPRPRWRVLVTPRWLGWHMFAVAAVAGMIWLGDWQLRRALAGNTLSWAYTFEWPIFAIFGVVFWIKTIRDELRPARPEGAEPAQVTLPTGIKPPMASAAGGEPAADPADVELAEYNAYLAKLSAQAKGHGRWHGLR
jgi:hypothetical protein